MIRLKNWFSWLLVAVVGSALFVTPAFGMGNLGIGASATKVIKVQSGLPLWIEFIGPSLSQFAARVEKRSKGTISMEFTDGELVPSADMLAEAAKGEIIQGCFSPPHDFEKDPFEYVIYSTPKPIGLDPNDYLKWLVKGGGRELLRQKILTKYKLVPVFVNMLPDERAGFYRYEIETLEQLRDPNFTQPNGDKWEIRMLGLGGEIVERSTVGNLIVHKTLSLGETIDKVNEGKLLGFEFSLAPIDYQVWIKVLGYDPTALMPYYYGPGWHQPSQNNILFINEAVWNSLTPGEQALIEEAGLETLKENLKEAQQAEHDALNDWKDKGAQLRILPREILDEFKAKSKEVLNEIAAENPDVADVRESMRRF